MAPTSKPTPPSSSLIHATSQQTRFKDTGNTLEVDLKDVTISIGEVELLSSVHLRLKEGVRYGLVGRSVPLFSCDACNGTDKVWGVGMERESQRCALR